MNKQEYFNEAIQKIEDFTDYPTINLVAGKWEKEPQHKKWYSVLRDGIPTQIIHWEQELERVYVIEISPTKVDFFIKYTGEPLDEIPDQVGRDSINRFYFDTLSYAKEWAKIKRREPWIYIGAFVLVALIIFGMKVG